MPVMLGCAWYLSVGFGMIYCLAALQHVDRRLYDAARVDGAGAWGRFWHITLPQVRPTLSFLTIAGAVWALQVFELPFVLFDQTPGPGYRGLTAVMYLFAVGFERGDLSYAAAIGWIFTIVVVVITGLMAWSLRIGREEVQA
jgi:ABC-type sugar transport system permease subunit